MNHHYKSLLYAIPLLAATISSGCGRNGTQIAVNNTGGETRCFETAEGTDCWRMRNVKLHMPLAYRATITDRTFVPKDQPDLTRTVSSCAILGVAIPCKSDQPDMVCARVPVPEERETMKRRLLESNLCDKIE